MDDLPTPITRSEQYLAKIAGNEPTLPVPITREERYLAKIAGEDVDIPPAPITRTEQYLAAIVEGGGEAEDGIITRTISGAYTNARVSAIGSSAFTMCGALTAVSFPEVSSINNYAFYSCTSLATASFPKATSIGNSAFLRCYRLVSLYLLGSSLATLAGTNALSSTPIGGHSAVAGQYGSIFVPSSLYATYLTANNWSAFADRFVSV